MTPLLFRNVIIFYNIKIYKLYEILLFKKNNNNFKRNKKHITTKFIILKQ